MGIFYTVNESVANVSDLDYVTEAVYDGNMDTNAIAIQVMAECAYNEVITQGIIEHTVDIVTESKGGEAFAKFKEKLKNIMKAFKTFVMKIWAKLKGFFNTIKEKLSKKSKDKTSTKKDTTTSSADNKEEAPKSNAGGNNMVTLINTKKLLSNLKDNNSIVNNMKKLIAELDEIVVEFRTESKDIDYRNLEEKFSYIVSKKIPNTFIASAFSMGDTNYENGFDFVERTIEDYKKKYTFRLSDSDFKNANENEYFYMDTFVDVEADSKAYSQVFDMLIKAGERYSKFFEEAFRKYLDMGNPDSTISFGSSYADSITKFTTMAYTILNKSANICQQSTVKIMTIKVGLQQLNDSELQKFRNFKQKYA